MVPFDTTRRILEATSIINIILYETDHWCLSHEKEEEKEGDDGEDK
jgi:hypothetical protein